MRVWVLSHFSCVWLFVTPWIAEYQAVVLQAKILEWVAMPSSRGSSQPRDQTHISMSPALAGRFFTSSATWEALISSVQLLSHVWLFVTPWTAGNQASQSLLKLPELAQTHVHWVSDAICAAIGSPILIHIFPLFGFPSHLGHHRALNSLCYIMGCHLFIYFIHQFSSVQFSRSVVSDSLQPHELQHARPPCPSPTPGVHSNSGPSSQRCHPAISASVVPFSSCPQSLQHHSLFQWVNSLHEVAKYWSFSFSIIPSKEIPGLLSFRMDWLDLLAVQGTLKSLLQHHSSKASIVLYKCQFQSLNPFYFPLPPHILMFTISLFLLCK